MLRGEAAELALQALDPLADLEALGGRRVRALLRRVDRLRVDGLGAPARKVVQRRVVRDAQEPRAEGGVAAEVREAMEGAQEGVLAHVLGILAAHHAGSDPHDDLAVALDELLERAQVARGRPLDERRILLGCRCGGLIRAHDRLDGQDGVRVTPIDTP